MATDSTHLTLGQANSDVNNDMAAGEMEIGVVQLAAASPSGTMSGPARSGPSLRRTKRL